MLRGVLLTLHLLGVIVWLGAGLYDLFVAHEIRRARGTPAEVTLARVYVRYGPVIAGSVLVVATTGALQTVLLGWGWFRELWLGALQALMLGVLAVLFSLFPTWARMGRAVSAHAQDARELSEEARALFARSGRRVPVMRALAFAALLLAVFRPALPAAATPETRQEHVHPMGHQVMPFDLSQPTHVFSMTETGGVLRVVAKDPGAADQIAHIQRHLSHEAARFAAGDFSGPAALHGADMPGLRELEAGAARMEIAYASRPDGGEIRFATDDRKLLTAVHRWFGAQLSEHGADARAEREE